MSCTLGITSGDPGGAVLLDAEGRLCLAVVWRLASQARHARYWFGGGDVHEAALPPRVSALGDWLCGRLVTVSGNSEGLAQLDLAVEDYAPPEGARIYFGPSPATAISLARWGGLVAAPLESRYQIEAHYVSAAAGHRPGLVPGLAEAQAVLGQSDQLGNAGRIAQLCRRGRASGFSGKNEAHSTRRMG